MPQKVLNKKSSVVKNEQPLLPGPEEIEFGEIAINYATDHETIAIKNASGQIATFSSDVVTNQKINSLSGSVSTIDSEVSAHTGNLSLHLPVVTSGDNNSVLMVVDGQWTVSSPITLYSGQGEPSQNLGNNGDVFLQTE